MRKALSRIMLTGVLVATSFGMLGGGSADAVEGCIYRPGLYSTIGYYCFRTSPGVVVQTFTPRVGGTSAGHEGPFTGAVYYTPNGKFTGVFLYCDGDTYQLITWVHKPSATFRNTHIAC